MLSSTLFNRECVTIRAYRSRFSHLEDYPVTATGRKRLSLTFESVVSDFPVAGVAELADALDSKSSGRKAVWVRAPPPAGLWTLGCWFGAWTRDFYLCAARISRDAFRLRIKATARQATPVGMTTFARALGSRASAPTACGRKLNVSKQTIIGLPLWKS